MCVPTGESVFWGTCNYDNVRYRVKGLDCGDLVAHWLTNVLNRHCRLVRQNPTVQRNSKRSVIETPLSLANEAQYLLVSQSSVDHLRTAVLARGGPELNDLCTRFRPNLVIGGGLVAGDDGCRTEPYAEEKWENVTIKGTSFKVSVFVTDLPCPRLIFRTTPKIFVLVSMSEKGL